MLLKHVIAKQILSQSRRQASTSSSPNPEAALKSCLNAMYKLVHPDLFHNVEQQRAENERSLKLLQDYISQARDAQRFDSALPQFRFVFYVKSTSEKSKNSNYGGKTSTEDSTFLPGSQVSRVDLLLPPPPRNPTNEYISVGAQKALAKLMASVGVPSDLLDKLLEEANTNRLRDFLPEAVEDIRQNEATGLGSKPRVTTIVNALRLGRQVHVGFGQDCKDLSALHRVKILEDIAWALDQAQDIDTKGLWILVGDQSGIDANGRLWLDRQHNRDDWATQLTSLDTSLMKLRVVESQKVHGLEREAAQAAGLSMVYTSGKHQNDPAYSDFLQRIIKTSMVSGPVGGGRFSRIPVCILPHSADLPQECSVNDDVGFISVPVHLGPERLYEFVQANGQKLMTRLEEKKKQDNEFLELQKRARLLLRVRKLEKSPQVSLSQFRSCCCRLMRHSHSLSVHMDGVSLRVSTENKVSDDKTVVNVAWDFVL